MIIERKFQHIFVAALSSLSRHIIVHSHSHNRTHTHSTIRSRLNVVCFMSQTQQNVYDVVELIAYTERRTHKQLLWWATKSDDISTAHNTYKHNFNSNFPMEIMIFGPFCSQQQQKQRMNCEKCRLLVPLWVVCKQVDLISYPRTYTHAHMCSGSLATVKSALPLCSLNHCSWIWIGAIPPNGLLYITHYTAWMQRTI